jgi:hypothetical protein
MDAAATHAGVGPALILARTSPACADDSLQTVRHRPQKLQRSTQVGVRSTRTAADGVHTVAVQLVSSRAAARHTAAHNLTIIGAHLISDR